MKMVTIITMGIVRITSLGRVQLLLHSVRIPLAWGSMQEAPSLMNMDNVSYTTLLTLLVVTNLRPTDDVRELFNKKTHGMKKTDLNAHHSVDRRAEMAKQ